MPSIATIGSVTEMRGECCANAVDEILIELQRREAFTLNPFLQAVVDARLARMQFVREVLPPFRVVAANLAEQATAKSCPTTCKCGSPLLLVIVSAPLLLLVWRTQHLFASMIRRWELDGPRLIVETSELSQVHRDALAALLTDYLGESAPMQLDASRVLSAWEQVPAGARAHFHDNLELGQTWIIAHELSHALTGYPNVQRFVQRARATVDASIRYRPLSQRARRSWVEEVSADVLAVWLMFVSMLQHLAPDGSATVIQRETVASAIAGGIAAASEAIMHAVRSAPPELFLEDEEITHPPIAMRYEIMSQFLVEIAAARPEVDLLCLAQIVGGLSKRFDVPAAYPTASADSPPPDQVAAQQ